MLMLSYIYNVFNSIFIHAMDEIFMSEIKKTVSYRLVSFKQEKLQMSSILSQIWIGLHYVYLSQIVKIAVSRV